MLLFVPLWLLSAGVAGATERADAAPSWNQWRGPNRDGRIAGPPWLGTLAGLEQAWRVELGKGYASPLVVADRVFVAETVDGKREAVRALARADGSELWRASWPAEGRVPFFAAARAP